MAAGGDEMIKQLSDITECCICMRTYTDPRILPCVHTFCLKCLRKIANNSENTFQEQMPCPVCRNSFSIPKTGLSGLQKNFFMAKLVEMTKIPRQVGNGSKNTLSSQRKDGVEFSQDCCCKDKDGLCEDCIMHKPQDLAEGGREGDDDNKEDEEEEEDESEKALKRMSGLEFKCDQHSSDLLEVYCHDCQTIICYKCLVDEHKGHKGSSVDSVASEFRQEIQSNLEKVSNYKVLSQGLIRESGKQRESAVGEFDKAEKAALERSRELKDLVERHTRVVLDELLTAKKERLKEMEMEKEESERYQAILESSEAYFSEVLATGSPTDICRVKDEMNRRTNDLGEILSRFELCSVKVSFRETNLEESVTANENVVGKIQIDAVKVDPFQSSILVVGLSQDQTESPESPKALRIDLETPMKVSAFDSASSLVNRECAAAVNNNLLFVSGLGEKADEIWKYHLVSGWIKCGTLIHGRIRHCVAFVADILYICGGYADPNGVIDRIEAYNTLSNKSLEVGKLIRGVRNATCVPYRTSVYVFFGLDAENKQMDDIQVYDTVQNTCGQLRGPNPRHFSPTNAWKAVQWKTSVILVGRWTCFVFDLELETWKQRKHLRADVDYFGLVLDGGNVYVIGGGVDDIDADDKWFWKRHDDVRCLPVEQIIRKIDCSSWKSVATLPFPALVYTCSVVAFPVEE